MAAAERFYQLSRTLAEGMSSQSLETNGQTVRQRKRQNFATAVVEIDPKTLHTESRRLLQQNNRDYYTVRPRSRLHSLFYGENVDPREDSSGDATKSLPIAPESEEELPSDASFCSDKWTAYYSSIGNIPNIPDEQEESVILLPAVLPRSLMEDPSCIPTIPNMQEGSSLPRMSPTLRQWHDRYWAKPLCTKSVIIPRELMKPYIPVGDTINAKLRERTLTQLRINTEQPGFRPIMPEDINLGVKFFPSPYITLWDVNKEFETTYIPIKLSMLIQEDPIVLSSWYGYTRPDLRCIDIQCHSFEYGFRPSKKFPFNTSSEHYPEYSVGYERAIPGYCDSENISPIFQAPAPDGGRHITLLTHWHKVTRDGNLIGWFLRGWVPIPLKLLSRGSRAFRIEVSVWIGSSRDGLILQSSADFVISSLTSRDMGHIHGSRVVG